MSKSKKTLFIVKERQSTYGYEASSGLKNSTLFIVEALQKRGYIAHLEQVVDGNDIDRVVTKYRPDYVIIEAFWVTPAKFLELMKIHKNVKWFVRNHSRPAFASQEGIIFEWTPEYEKIGVRVGYNSWTAKEQINNSINKPLNLKEALYLPNIYVAPNTSLSVKSAGITNKVKVGCFGAIRPLKNQAQQFLSAIEFSLKNNKYLEFYINSTRAESGGEPVLKSLRAIGKVLKDTGKGKLVEVEWTEHDEFLKVVSSMDVVMQVSFSETFNIVSADSVSVGVPVIVSDQVFWAASDKWLDVRRAATVDPNSSEQIIEALENLALDNYKLKRKVLNAQLTGLNHYNHHSIDVWEKFLA